MGRSSSRRSTPKRNYPAKQTPQPTTPTVPQQSSTFGDAVKGGVGMGLGIEAVRAGIGAVTGGVATPNQAEQTFEQPQIQEVCKYQKDALLACATSNSFDCTEFMQAYRNCINTHQSV